MTKGGLAFSLFSLCADHFLSLQSFHSYILFQGPLMAATAPSNTSTYQKAPSRRGRVKAQIFGSLAGNLYTAASKTAEALGKIKLASASTSAAAAVDEISPSASPPPSGPLP
ncbi:hypothetical protein MIMGU_mgv1a025301mg [Erythranthe guttata]|uniref:Uncharacterized protein n=1 Tax=Erythranthe guttata TaxID=4155 RepID=A0A022PXB9_ERYGU|nr:hypothetical protein MIMGU_mgv1a025301mg [Erythranthe guttata]